MIYPVGTKVKITKAKHFQPEHTIGKIGIIVGHIYQGYQISFINKKFKHRCFEENQYDWLYALDEVTPINKKIIKK